MEQKIKHIGVVSLYHPHVDEFVRNCKRYITHLDRLVIWNNSAPEAHVVEQLRILLDEFNSKIEWVDCRENRCIAPAINHTLKQATAEQIELILVMDQDSYWADFGAYLADVDTSYLQDANIGAWAPYVFGCYDKADVDIATTPNLINSGTIFRTSSLEAIGGADLLFPLDGLDNDMAFRLRKAGYRLVCLPRHEMKHELGHPIRSRFLRIYSTNYNAIRTYSITRAQLLIIKRHHDIMSWQEIWVIVKEYIFWKFIRIWLVEPDKWNRFRAYCRGIHDAIHTHIK